jgi:hypothetical protein
MARFTIAQLQQFRRNSRCEDCVHYTEGCPLWMALLLANEEDLATPGLDMFINIDMPCPMFFTRDEKPARHVTHRLYGSPNYHSS